MHRSSSLAVYVVLVAVFLLADFGFGQVRYKMPGKSFVGKVPELTEEQNSIARRLTGHVSKLSQEIGERNVYQFANLSKAERYLAKELILAGYEIERQTFEVRGRECVNLIAERWGADLADEYIVVGGHYDSAVGATGANDNATGTAATIELARLFAKKETRRTIRFVLFTNEEQPWFQTHDMGSFVYARRCRDRKENVIAMFSLETMGYFSDRPNSQRYPRPLSNYYPSKGNFIAFVSDTKSMPLVSWVTATFRKHGKVPSEGGSLLAHLPGVGWSDQWSFWQNGYRAIMVTDTAIFRYPHYHKKSDTVDKVDFKRLTHVVSGLEQVLDRLATPTDQPLIATNPDRPKFPTKKLGKKSLDTTVR